MCVDAWLAHWTTLPGLMLRTLFSGGSFDPRLFTGNPSRVGKTARWLARFRLSIGVAFMIRAIIGKCSVGR